MTTTALPGFSDINSLTLNTNTGTNELLLTCTLIRYQKIMNEVKIAYEEMKGKTLEEEVKSETGGDYERILLEIVNAGE